MMNWEYNSYGVQIYFDSKPKDEIISALKNNKFRWSPAGKCWWRKNTAGTADFITWLSNQKTESEAGE